MIAAVLRNFGEDLQVEDIETPVPADDEVLVRVRAVGICGTDVKISQGLIPGVRTPLVLGHEVSGELVTPAAGLPAGQRVAAYIFRPCRRCLWCLRGNENLCANSGRIGFERPGGLAEFMSLRPQDLIPFSSDLDFGPAAVAMDAVLSPWRALHVRGELAAGDRVLVVGAGGLGLHAIQIVVAAGAQAAVVEPDERRRQVALSNGATVAVDVDDIAEVRKWAGSGIDIALEASGSPEGFAACVSAVRRGGVIVCCGYRPGGDLALSSMKLAMEEIRVVGSRGGSRTDATAALRAVENGRIVPIIAGHGGLADAGRFIRELERDGGNVTGRMVVDV